MNQHFSVRKISACIIPSLLISVMAVLGWQSSVKYDTLVLQTPWLKGLGTLSAVQCVLTGGLGFVFGSMLLYFLFSFLEKENFKSEKRIKKRKEIPYLWPITSVFLFGCFVVWLWCCYPGYYNYDMGNQLPQVLYADVPYNAHHPLLHTLIGGGIIKLGYKIKSTDLIFGVFLYNLTQAFLSAIGFGYTLDFVYKKSKSLILLGLSFAFFAFCPSIIIFGMSTTKDVPCYLALLVGSLMLYRVYEDLLSEREVKWTRWVTTGFMLMLSCLLRKNIIYAIVVFAVFAILWIRKSVGRQLLMYVGIFLGYFVINNALILGLNAPRSSSAEAMSVPFQQIARLYHEYGEEAFTDDELDVLYSAIDPEMILTYDPANADNIKTSFWYHLDTIMSDKPTYFSFWARKGMQYPQVYLQATIDNTYQAWYPWTKLQDKRKARYVDITYWQDDFGRSNVKSVSDYFAGTNEHNYTKIVGLRLLLTTGTFVWTLLIAMGYGFYKKNKSMFAILLLAFLVTGTSWCGPVMDIRYFLIIFYLLPVELALMIKREDRIEEKTKEKSKEKSKEK